MVAGVLRNRMLPHLCCGLACVNQIGQYMRAVYASSYICFILVVCQTIHYKSQANSFVRIGLLLYLTMALKSRSPSAHKDRAITGRMEKMYARDKSRSMQLVLDEYQVVV